MSARAEGIILKYVYFLHEKDVLKNYKMEKTHARDLYMVEFKLKHNIKKFPFSTMYRFMGEFGLINRRSKRSEFLHFREDMYNYSIRYFTHSDLKPNVNRTNVKPASSKTTTKHECNECKENFLNVKLLSQHQQSETHLLKKQWIEEHNATSTPQIAVEVVEGYGVAPETVVIRPNVPHTILLGLSNQSSNNFIILDMVGKSSSHITIRKLKCPYTLEVNCKWDIELIATFQESMYLCYKLAFYVQNTTTNTYSFLVKELNFQVLSELLDDLRPSEPFCKEPHQTIRNGEVEIVPGVHPPPTTSGRFVSKIKLQQYHLPHYMVVLLDNNFTQFQNMNVTEKNMLAYITKQFAYYSRISTLDVKSYYTINQLRLYMEEYQMKIDIRSYDAKDQLLQSVKSYPHCFELTVPGLSEHRPSILRGDAVYIQESPESKVKYEGIVHKINQNTVILGLSYSFAETVHVKNKRYAVSFTFNRIPLRTEHQANELAKNHDVIHFFFPSKIITNPLTVNNFVWYNPGIAKNDKQQQAIRHIVSATSQPFPYLIFGPPGTGKTITVVEAILQIRKLTPDKKILVCAPTNSAADQITKRLISYSVSKQALFRYLAPSYSYDLIDRDVKPYTNFRDEFYHPTQSEIQSYHIVVTTLITAFRLVNGGISPNHFSYVFIDESGQATETETLIPIAGILTSMENKGSINGQIVLVGDPKQLGPVIHSRKAKDFGFGMSMLERLMIHCAPYKKNKDTYDSNVLTKLINSYRSHPAILKLPNKLFYDEELIPPPEDHHLQNVALGWPELPNKNFPVLFHSVMGQDERESNSPSYFNLQEVDVVIRYLEKLINQRLSGMKIEESHIGVITPYRKQVSKLKAACAKKKWNTLQIGSVEQFQGQERLIIIVSTVRSDIKFAIEDVKFHLGFVQNPKRFNVALTRAKALLIVVGNPNLLQYDPHWKAYIQYCMDNGSISGSHFELESDTMNDMLLALPQQNGIPNNDVKEEGVNFSRGDI